MTGAFYTGKYRNVFREYGYDEEEIQRRVEDTWNKLFYGDENTRIYWPVDDDMGYILDTGNNDVRTEGMSYGMMMCVQMDKRKSSTGSGSGHIHTCSIVPASIKGILHGR